MPNDHPATTFQEVLKNNWADILLQRRLKRIVGALSDASQSKASGGVRREGTRLHKVLNKLDPQLSALADGLFNPSNEKKKEYGSGLTAELFRKGKDDPELLNRVSEEMGVRKEVSNTVGLALSGGGIRSATFNLRVLQALARYKLLRHIDYLSTVSGGGYIGSWRIA